jgi:uncharacterized cupin superfamily protein
VSDSRPAFLEGQLLAITAFEMARTDLGPEPIDPSWIREGAPVARAIRLIESSDGKLSAGIWDCTAGKFRWSYWFDEIVHIVEGEVRVDDGKKVHVLVPGSVAIFPSGLETVWEVPKYVKKMFVLRAPKEALVGRVLGAVKRRVEAVTGRPLPGFSRRSM